MASMDKKLYKNSPTMERNAEGKMAAKKGPTEAEKKSSEVNAGTEGVAHEGMPPHARHALERRDMHNRHETEHAIHDNGKGGSKKDMHGRHEKEMAEMHKRHDKESTGSGGGKEKIEKVSK